MFARRLSLVWATAMLVAASCASSSSGESLEIPRHDLSDFPADVASGTVSVEQTGGWVCVHVDDVATGPQVLLVFPPDASVSTVDDFWRVSFDGQTEEIRPGTEVVFGGGHLTRPFERGECAGEDTFFTGGS